MTYSMILLTIVLSWFLSYCWNWWLLSVTWFGQSILHAPLDMVEEQKPAKKKKTKKKNVAPLEICRCRKLLTIVLICHFVDFFLPVLLRTNGSFFLYCFFVFFFKQIVKGLFFFWWCCNFFCLRNDFFYLFWKKNFSLPHVK